MNEADDDAGRQARLTLRRRAMDLLARREHARAELAGKLKKRGYAENDIEAVLDALEEDGLLSDASFAQAAVASKARRGVGPVRIRAELRQVGAAEDAVAAALEAAEIDWDERARAARRKRFGADRSVDYPAKAKQMRFLQRRGFDIAQIAAAFADEAD